MSKECGLLILAEARFEDNVIDERTKESIGG